MGSFKFSYRTNELSIDMPLMYPVKHVFRNWKLFAALLIGVTLAATFCAALGVKANLSAEQSLDKQISNVITDIQLSVPLNRSNLVLACNNITNIAGVKEFDYAARVNLPVSISSDNFSRQFYTQLTAFPNSSRIYEEWINKPPNGLPENYTYIVAGSPLAQQVKVGDNITTIVTFQQPKYWNQSIVPVNFTVAGFAELTDKGYYLISPYGSAPIYYSGIGGSSVQASSPYIAYRGDLMIVSWENTLEKLWSATLDSSQVDISFSVNVDREKLLSPWNIEASINNVNAVADSVENQVLSYIARGTMNNRLSQSLSTFNSMFGYTVISYILISIPIFFVAWYLGQTVSDVSFNIRRREIGLLSTKGLSSGQIQRMFLSEAILIGLIGGFLGVVGGLILNQYYAGAVDLNNLFTSQMLTPSVMIVTVIFGVVLSFAAVFWPSRKASKMPAVEALRDYVPTDNKSRWRFVPWIALILGGYKIVVFALGINVSNLFYGMRYSSGNFFLSIIAGPVVFFDVVMTYIGPFLFFWGLTKVVIRDSTKFQTAAIKISSVMGDLGALAAKNVRRNPARLAAVAFLIAFIIGYGVQVNGQIASQQDYNLRQVQEQVGADVTVNIVNASKAELIYDEILGNVSGIRNASIERMLTAPISESNKYNRVPVRTIDVDTWGDSAYYDPAWFTGLSIDQMLKEMKGNNATIVLDRSLAKQAKLGLYDLITVDFDSCPRQLKIIGFFGPEPPDSASQVNIGGISVPSTSSYYSRFYSYVPRDLFNMTMGSVIYTVESFTQTRILINLDDGINGTQVAEQIRTVDPTEIYGVDSFDEQWRSSTEGNNLVTYGSLQVLDVQGLGLMFAVLSASIGTALIAIVSLKERSREATLMSVRGLSYRQLVWMFLTESMAIITFAIILGVVVGAIILFGSVTSTNNIFGAYSLVTPRLVYPADALTTIGTYIALIYSITIGAILVMTSQYVTKLEKMVRAR